jgi:hypothetical protein
MIFLVLSVWTFLHALFGGAAATGILSLVPFWRPPVLARPFWNRVSGDGSEFGIVNVALDPGRCPWRRLFGVPLPWIRGDAVSTQWYKATTPEEDKFRRKRRRWAVAGVVVAGRGLRNAGCCCSALVAV